jgi:hypothetical protein
VKLFSFTLRFWFQRVEGYSTQAESQSDAWRRLLSDVDCSQLIEATLFDIASLPLSSEPAS